MYSMRYVKVALLAAATAGCGGETSPGDRGGASCPNIAGTWLIASHCDQSFVGDDISITQSGCNFQDQAFGFSGSIGANGSFTASSTLGGESATCTGNATANSIVQNCTVLGGSCSVSLSR